MSDVMLGRPVGELPTKTKYFLEEILDVKHFSNYL